MTVMGHIQDTERMQCAACVAAMVMDINLSDMLLLLRHDGKEVLFQGEPSPFCYRGHHVQELMAVGLSLGYSWTMLEREPRVFTPDRMSRRQVFDYPQHPGHLDRLALFTKDAHWLAWCPDSRLLHDPGLAAPTPGPIPHERIQAYFVVRKCTRF